MFRGSPNIFPRPWSELSRFRPPASRVLAVGGCQCPPRRRPSNRLTLGTDIRGPLQHVLCVGVTPTVVIAGGVGGVVLDWVSGGRSCGISGFFFGVGRRAWSSGGVGGSPTLGGAPDALTTLCSHTTHELRGQTCPVQRVHSCTPSRGVNEMGVRQRDATSELQPPVHSIQR